MVQSANEWNISIDVVVAVSNVVDFDENEIYGISVEWLFFALLQDSCEIQCVCVCVDYWPASSSTFCKIQGRNKDKTSAIASHRTSKRSAIWEFDSVIFGIEICLIMPLSSADESLVPIHSICSQFLRFTSEFFASIHSFIQWFDSKRELVYIYFLLSSSDKSRWNSRFATCQVDVCHGMRASECVCDAMRSALASHGKCFKLLTQAWAVMCIANASISHTHTFRSCIFLCLPVYSLCVKVCECRSCCSSARLKIAFVHTHGKRRRIEMFASKFHLESSEHAWVSETKNEQGHSQRHSVQYMRATGSCSLADSVTARVIPSLCACLVCFNRSRRRQKK